MPESKSVRIGDVPLGGRPGEHSCVMVGSIFYAGHRIVTDEARGEFDRDKARELVERQAQTAQMTGQAVMLDVIASTERALVAYIEFLASITEVPLLVDSMAAAARLGAIRHFAGLPLVSRLVYNSIDEHTTREEIEAIAAAGIKSAVVLAFSNTAVKPGAKVKLLGEQLLPAARAAGVENILVDPGVLDMAGIGWTALAMEEIKAQTGYPVGCAPSNALYNWKRARGLASPVFEAAAGAALAYLVRSGADFLFYGPVANAPWALPACAAADGMRAYAARLSGIRPQDRTHPLGRFL